MDDDAKVFKLVGPVLMAVDFAESKQNVGKRLEFIEAEIKKIDNQIAVGTESQNRLADEVGPNHPALCVFYLLVSRPIDSVRDRCCETLLSAVHVLHVLMCR
jgi:hypothetical protein